MLWGGCLATLSHRTLCIIGTPTPWPEHQSGGLRNTNDLSLPTIFGY